MIINGSLAAEIYKEKLALIITPTSFESGFKDDARVEMKGKSVQVSAKYGVSAKTVRDIWNRRTWIDATSFLWSIESLRSEGEAAEY
jgi:hypothetical protein